MVEHLFPLCDDFLEIFNNLFMSYCHKSLYFSIPYIEFKCISFFTLANERGINCSQYSPIVYSVCSFPVTPFYSFYFLRPQLNLKGTKISTKLKILCCRLSAIWVLKNIWGKKINV